MALRTVSASWDYGPPADRTPPDVTAWTFKGKVSERFFRGRVERVFPLVAEGHIGSSHFTTDDYREWLWPWHYELDEDSGRYEFRVAEYADADDRRSEDRPMRIDVRRGDAGAFSRLEDVWEHIRCVAGDWCDDWIERSIDATARRTGHRWQFVEGVAKSRHVSPDALLSFCRARGVPINDAYDREPMVDAAVFDEHIGWLLEHATREAENWGVRVARARHVYFVRAASTGLIKIGVTCNVDARFKSLRTMSADVLSILATMPGDPELERSLHERFKASRRHGEWFDPTPELLAYIARIQKEGPR